MQYQQEIELLEPNCESLRVAAASRRPHQSRAICYPYGTAVQLLAVDDISVTPSSTLVNFPLTSEKGKEKAVQPPLPIEVCERMIDSLLEADYWGSYRGCYKHLLACALTCRAWLPRSRRNLCYAVELGNLKQLHGFSTLASTGCALTDSTKELYINPDNSTESRIAASFSLTLARKLTNIDCLTISLWNANGHRIPTVPSSFYMAMSTFSSITKLHLIAVNFSTMTAFSRLICTLPNISMLTCNTVSWIRPHYSPATFTLSVQPLALRHLAMSWVELSGTLIRCMLAMTSITNLETLIVPRVTDKEVENVCTLLEAIGGSLRHLTIGFDGEPKYLVEKINASPMIMRNVNLKSIHLHVDEHGEWTAGFLSQVRSPRLSSLLMVVSANIDNRGFDRLGCGNIDEMLSTPQFAGLKELVFEHRCNTEREEWLHSEVEQRFHICLQKVSYD